MSGGMPIKCPACAQDMRVCLLKCPTCNTEVQGEFTLNRFSQLTDEYLAFLETFVRCRGSLKDLGTELKISYPTARNRLDQLIAALNFQDHKSETTRRLDILNQLKEGQITTEEALIRLQGGTNHE